MNMGFLPQVWAVEALEVLRSNVAIAAGGRESEAWRYQCRAFRDDRYRRKVERVIEHPVTDEERAAFAAAESAWALLEESPYFEIDGFDANPILTPPQARREYVYAETEAEWIERCRRIDAED